MAGAHVYVSSAPTAGLSDSSQSTYTTESAQESATRIITLHSLTDDGAGAFVGGMGTVDYVGKAASVKVVTHGRSTTSYKSDYEDAAAFSASVAGAGSTSGSSNAKGGSYDTTTLGEQVLAGSSVVATYKVGTPTPTARSMSYQPPEVVIDLCRYTSDRIVPGSVRFVWMGQIYEDHDGIIYRRTGVGNGVASGTMDYAAGLARMTDYVVSGSASDFALQSLWTSKGDWRTSSVFGMTAAAPVLPGQITFTVLDVAGDEIVITSDLSGNLSGTHATGKVNQEHGLFEIQFGDLVADSSLSAADKSEWWYDPADVGAVESGKIWRPWPVDPNSLRYTMVAAYYLPLDEDIIGLPPERLPADGMVPGFRKGRVIVIGHNATIAAATYAAGTVDLGRERVSHVWLIDANGDLITEGWTATEADLNAGEIRITDVTGWAQPVKIEHRIQQMLALTDVQIDGTLKVNKQLSHDFPVGSVVSSALLFGNTFARVAEVFDQNTWNGTTWSDTVQGDPAPATYNIAANPIVVTNAGALSERYAIQFTNTTDFKLIGEFSGQIATGNKNERFEPANPFNPAAHLMEVAEAGWGSGWVAGNVMFPKLVAAMQSMAVIRAVQPSESAALDFDFDLLVGGDIDREPSA